MVTMKCVKAYEAAGLDGRMMILMPDMDCVSYGRASYVPTRDETEAQILDRIERSKKAGRNLFFEEWELWEPEPGCIY